MEDIKDKPKDRSLYFHIEDLPKILSAMKVTDDPSKILEIVNAKKGIGLSAILKKTK